MTIMSFPSHNLVVAAGVLSSDPRPRILASGDELVQLELTTRPPGGDAASVPVSAHTELTSKLDLSHGAEIVVIGQVRRRFFRAGGITQSRTEVVASQVFPAKRRAAATRAVERAVALLTDA